MIRPLLQRISALAMLGIAGAFTISSCVLRIETSPNESSAIPTDSIPIENPPQEEPSPEDAAQALAMADPNELALVTAKTSYALYLVNGSIEGLGLAPETLDEPTLQKLVEEYLPWAMAEAETWSAGVEPSMLLSSIGKPPPWREDCPSAFGCPHWVRCWSLKRDSAIHCYPTDCGDGKCKPCPDWFGGFAKIAMKGWCSYACVGTDGSVVGGAGVVIGSFKLFQIPFCLLDGIYRAPL